VTNADERKIPIVFWILLAVFAAVNGVLIWQEFFWLPALPALIGVVLLAVLSLDQFVILIAFLTPLSVNLEDEGVGVALSLPSEPMIITAMMLFVIKFLMDGKYDFRILKHPIAIAVIIQIIWMFMTSVSSSLPIVSFKFLISRIWFVLTFFFLGVEVFRRRENIFRFVWAHIFGLLCVIVYTTYVHWTWAFEKDPAHWVMSPFYHDHTAYGMILALFLPVVAGLTFYNRFGLFTKILIFGIFLSYVIGFRLSNSRAAWLSLVIAIGIYFLYRFRIKWYLVVLAGIIGISGFLTIQEQLIISLGRNKQDSSENLDEQIQSMSNISTDASNLERINRWNSAIGMWEDRPWLGFGPGTYKFEYAAFQRAKDKTVITTNAGNRGTAHSEYLLPLSEQGTLGPILFLLVILTTVWTTGKVYYSNADPALRRMGLWLGLGLITYWIHGLLNNFLDLDKAAVPYWGFTAVLVAIHLYHTGLGSARPDGGDVK
jgi:putative inorganic carbon (HCO3(-)) transporter